MTLVYATDYTSNTMGLGLRPVRTDWCPANLATSTLQIEFYGAEAANFVRKEEIAKDQIWTFRNVRMKSAGGDQYLEASYSETRKAIRLKEEEKETGSAASHTRPMTLVASRGYPGRDSEGLELRRRVLMVY